MPQKPKICKHCKHFFVTGLGKDWGGEVGFCKLIQFDKNNQKLDKDGCRIANSKALMHKTDTCDRFEMKV